jgi:phosphonoacetate hydrolase
MQKAARVVVVVFDGLRPDMVTPELMPRLSAFGATSSWFREARSVFPSMTRVATTSIATGAMPRVHGIVGNAFYCPEALPEHAIDTSLLADIARAEARLGRSLYDAPTFADALAKAGKRLSIVHTGSAGSALALNPRADVHGHWTFAMLGAQHTRTPHAVEEAVTSFGPLPERDLPRFAETAYAANVFCDIVLKEQQPDVALIWFNEPDTSYHYKFIGAPETLAVMNAADEAFGLILDTIAVMPGADDTAIIVASDHGQISSHGTFDIARALTEAGHPARSSGNRSLEGAKLAVTGGNMGEIRVLDGDMDRRDAIARWLMAQDQIGMVFMPSDDPLRGTLEGTLPSSLLGIDHARQPELLYVLRSDVSADPYGYPGLGLITGGVPVGGGMHGGLNRHELNTVLMLGGTACRTPGVSAAPCGIIDIAPTILDLLGLAPLPSMEGSSLLGVDAADPGMSEEFVAANGTFRQSLRRSKRDGRFFLAHGERQ